MKGTVHANLTEQSLIKNNMKMISFEIALNCT